MRDRADNRTLNAEALTIMRYATVADLKAECDELTELIAGLDEPLRRRILALLSRL